MAPPLSRVGSGGRMMTRACNSCRKLWLQSAGVPERETLSRSRLLGGRPSVDCRDEVCVQAIAEDGHQLVICRKSEALLSRLKSQV